MTPFLTADDRSNEALILFELSRPIGIAYDHRVEPLELTRAQWHLLSVLRRYPGIAQARAAEMMEVEPITLSRQLERMEREGWVRRQPDPHDRRANQVFLTDKVIDTMQQMQAETLRFREELVAGFSADEHRQFLHYLSRIRSNLQQIIRRDAEAGDASGSLIARQRKEQILELNLIG
ncbi:MAG: MarR family winged helix-turn-helix transcriptional regulator [Rickettsiales bacterium]